MVACVPGLLCWLMQRSFTRETHRHALDDAAAHCFIQCMHARQSACLLVVASGGSIANQLSCTRPQTHENKAENLSACMTAASLVYTQP